MLLPPDHHRSPTFRCGLTRFFVLSHPVTTMSLCKMLNNEPPPENTIFVTLINPDTQALFSSIKGHCRSTSRRGNGEVLIYKLLTTEMAGPNGRKLHFCSRQCGRVPGFGFRVSGVGIPVSGVRFQVSGRAGVYRRSRVESPRRMVVPPDT